jgi:hypothetical protein
MTVMAREALAEIGARYSELWAMLWPIIVSTIVMAAVVLLLADITSAEATAFPLPRLLLLSGAGAISYGMALFLLFRPMINEAAEVIGWVFRRQRASG